MCKENEHNYQAVGSKNVHETTQTGISISWTDHKLFCIKCGDSKELLAR